MSKAIGFDMGVPTVSLPLAPREIQGRLFGTHDWHESWHTVFLVLHEYGTDMSGVYALAVNRVDALVKATAYLLSKQEKRDHTWLEAWEYLRTCTYTAFTISDSVRFVEGLSVTDEVGRDVDKLVELEEQKRAAEKNRGSVLAATPEGRPEV